MAKALAGINLGDPLAKALAGINLGDPLAEALAGINIPNPMADVLAGINIPNPMADVMAGINIPNPLADVLRDFHASSTIADDPAREHGAIVLLVALFMVLYQAQLNAVAQGVVLATTRSLWTLWVLHSTIENGSPLGEAIIRAVDMLVFQLMFGSRAQGAASETD